MPGSRTLHQSQMNSDSEEEAAGILPEAIGACLSGDLETVKAWLDGGGESAPRSVNDLDEDGWSLLLWASGGYDEILTEEHVELARYLVSRGAQLEVASRFSGSTALHYACSSGGASPEFVSVLVAAGAHVNAEDENGRRPLGRITYSILDTLPDQMHHVEIVKILLRSGATLDFAMAMIPSTTFCGMVESTIAGEHFRAIEKIVASVRYTALEGALSRRTQADPPRSLVAHGRVKLPRTRRRSPRGRDARQERALEFVLRQGDNGTPSPTGGRPGKM